MQMKIVVSANGADLDAPASPVFGRCPMYVFVDTDSMESESVENPAINATGGAGIQAAQFVVERGAQAVVSGNVGPNAFGVLQSANVPVYLFSGGTIRQAVEGYKNGQLSAVGGANVQAHAGMGGGRGMGRGLGRGMGMGRQAAAMSLTPPASPVSSAGSRKEEIAALKDMAGAMRKQLAEVMDRLDRLEKGG
jgi:predicted Fe-Mo cluster-binding NifX family protein